MEKTKNCDGDRILEFERNLEFLKSNQCRNKVHVGLTIARDIAAYLNSRFVDGVDGDDKDPISHIHVVMLTKQQMEVMSFIIDLIVI